MGKRDRRSDPRLLLLVAVVVHRLECSDEDRQQSHEDQADVGRQHALSRGLGLLCVARIDGQLLSQGRVDLRQEGDGERHSHDRDVT